ncbi:putative surface protease GP63 [Trypanosoma theileri]|uniref:Leishmanolysin-like peptidase n=1 Tax=Trypanosoma theileri TaxID=67003 RepID=A0A1X0NX98_9TRYP|nr:putative surface protease GP63 [Trypanosoma theileri]ORC89326.1 putative surface protease GP63 [Trypanosoma theileri]
MEKHSMRHLLWTALFLLYCSCGCLATVVQQLPQKGQSGLQAYTVSTATDGKEGDWQPIRIAVYTKRVEDVLNFCGKNKLPPEYYEEFLDPQELEEEFEELCGDDGRKKMMIKEKKDILLDKVLPKAVKLHADRLKVKQVKESLKIESDTVTELPEECEAFGIPQRHKEKGIPDADFVIYALLTSSTRDVKICSKDGEGRPTSAVIKFILQDIEATRKYIRFTTHEIAHGLGFQHEFMDNLTMIEPSNSYLESKGVSVRVNTPRILRFKNSVDMLKNHYGCENGEIKGLYLENYNAWPSHWGSRIAKDELMSTYIGEPTGMYYTALTLATFHEMPFYSANFSMAEPMSWGNESLCEFLKGKKKEEMLNSHPNMFCKKEEKKEILQCTSDRFALGMCLTKKSSLDVPPAGYQYFSDISVEWDGDLMDGYPIIKPLIGTACEDGNETLLSGSLFGRDSRCLKADGLKLKDSNGTPLNIAGVCAKVKCDNEKKKVSVQLKGYEENKEEWHDCENDDKATVKLDGSVFSGGTIECPKYEEVCTGMPKTNSLKIKYYSGTQDLEAREVVVNDDDEKKEEVVKDPNHNENGETNEEEPPASPPTVPGDVVEENEEVPPENDNNGTETGKEPGTPEVPPTTNGETMEEEEVKEEDEEKENEKNETDVVPSGNGTTTEEGSGKQPTDTTTGPSDESHEEVNNNSSASEVPPNTEDSPQEKPSQGENSPEAEIPSEEIESSKPESPDKNDTTNIENGQDDNNTGNDSTDGNVENTNTPTGVNTGGNADKSIALSFFEPLMLLVCVVAAVVAL